MGFYPVNPASGEYVLGTPLANKSIINHGNGRHFVIRAENLSRQNIYIQKATMNGLPYTKSYIMHSDVMEGGELVLYMDDKPSDTWGVKPEDRPGRIN
jgi:putative alpha-1,2-mannosidase